jgi:hypothetical protein
VRGGAKGVLNQLAAVLAPATARWCWRIARPGAGQPAGGGEGTRALRRRAELDGRRFQMAMVESGLKGTCRRNWRPATGAIVGIVDTHRRMEVRSRCGGWWPNAPCASTRRRLAVTQA